MDEEMPNRTTTTSQPEGDRDRARAGHASDREGARTRNRPLDEEPIIPRAADERRHTPRRYDQPADDPALPSGSAGLGTKI